MEGPVIKCEHIKSTLQKVIEEVETRIEYGSKRGENFVAEIYRVLFNQKGDNHHQSLILKIATQDEMRRNQILMSEYFDREIRIYKKTLPVFRDFQLPKGINLKKDGFNEHAECYLAIEEQPFESLFLEDLKVNEFEMLDHRKDILTFDHVSLVMKALGKFHAISFALRDQQPKLFSELTSNLKENYWTIEKNKHLLDFLSMTFDKASKALKEDNCVELEEKYARAIKSGFSKIGANCVSGKNAEPYAVLCHGDVWTNNTMFRKDANGKPIEVKIFDWRFSRYASPVTDIILYLVCCTRKSLRDLHYDGLIQIYYESLSTLLIKLGSDPNKMFPYEVLLNQLKKFEKYGTITATILMTIFFVNPVETFDPIEVSEKKYEIKDAFQIPRQSKEEYRKALCDMVEDSARFGYI